MIEGDYNDEDGKKTIANQQQQQQLHTFMLNSFWIVESKIK